MSNLARNGLYRMREIGCVPDQPVEFHGGEVVAITRQLLGELSKSDRGSVIAMESLTAEILAAMLDRQAFREGPPAPKWLTEALEILEARFQEPLSLRAIAKEAGVHPIHFAAMFRRHYGCSAGEYMRRVRFEQLSILLRQRVPLAEIALAAGFADQSHLTRFLKRQTGMTPTQYRTFLAFKTGC